MTERYAILLPGDVLAHDHYRDRPATYAHRRSAARAQARLAYVAELSRVVRVTFTPGDDDNLPTYEVHL